jgi:ribonuclease G
VIIDFIDMDDERNRRAVKAALDAALERDRTRTYVVDISPLGLVEMTRQNISDGPREIMTEVCPTCAGVGVVASEETMAIAVERELRELLRGHPESPVAVAVHPRLADVLTGEDGARLAELQRETGVEIRLERDVSLAPDGVRVRALGEVAEAPPPRRGAASRRRVSSRSG